MYQLWLRNGIEWEWENGRNLSTQEYADYLIKCLIDDSEVVATLTLDDLNSVRTRMVDNSGKEQVTLLNSEVCFPCGWHEVTLSLIISKLHCIL